MHVLLSSVCVCVFVCARVCECVSMETLVCMCACVHVCLCFVCMCLCTYVPCHVHMFMYPCHGLCGTCSVKVLSYPLSGPYLPAYLSSQNYMRLCLMFDKVFHALN